ncbi:MAG: glycosyltransferase family 39 protein, partial [Anaerolineae bacterium]
MRALLVVLLGLSFALRIYRLDEKSLWTDEGLTVRRAEQPAALVVKNQNLIPVEPNYYDGTEVEVVKTPDLHPPLYFLLMHFWTRVAGDSEFALRFPSVVASTLALPLIFVLGSALLTRETGVWSTLLAAFSPFYIWHAQEARMYPLVVLLSVASVYTFLPLLGNAPQRRRYIVYVVTTSALLYTHYSGFLVLAFEVAMYGFHQSRIRRRAWPILVILAVLGLAILPLAPYIRRVLGLSLSGFISRPLSILLAELWSHFSLGIGESLIRPLWKTGPFLTLFAVGLLMVGVPRRRKGWIVCLGYLLVPILLFQLISYFKPNYMNPRHLLVISPAWELVMAQGLTSLRRRFWPGFAVLLALSMFLRGQVNYGIVASHSSWKDDIRGAADYIEARARPGDAIILHDPVIRLTFSYYYDGPYPVASVPSYGQTDAQEAIDRFAEWARRYDRIWFLYGPPPTNFPNDVVPNWADANLFKVSQRKFEAIWTYVGVAAYDDEPPLVEVLPSGSAARHLSWGPLRLTGFAAQDVPQGDDAWLELYWEADGARQDEPLRLKVRLLDERGMVWHEREEEVLPFYPPSAWPSSSTVRADLRLPLPDDLPPVTYTVEAAPVELGNMRTIGELVVAYSNEPSGTQRPRARFARGIELLDGELGSNVFRAGLPLFGSLTWRATAPVHRDYLLHARLTNLLGRQVTADEMRPSAAGFPTSAWVPGVQAGGQLILPIPLDLKSGRYRVQVSLIEKSSGDILP